MKKWHIGWGTTSACNMKCEFCYSKESRSTHNDSPLLDNIKFIDRNYSYIDSINYGTGENTLSLEWISLLSHVAKSFPEISQALTTNGSLVELAPGKQDVIFSALAEVDISLDFADEKKQNNFRNNEHAYRWALDCIDMCRSKGMTTTLTMLGIDQTLTEENLEKIFAIATERGCFVRINIFRPNAGQQTPILSYKALKESLKWIINNHKIVSLADPLISALIGNEEKKDGSGISSLRILPDGSVTPSTYLVSSDWKRGHILDLDLSDQRLSDRLIGHHKLNFEWPHSCDGCRVKHHCKGGAFDRRIIWHQTTDCRDPYCPLENDDVAADWGDLQLNVHVHGSRPCIHDGYLPTLIFAP
ncbi:MAG: radical SAM protein [Nitrospirae bacterium]|nr:radical SAM protein [Magnetococcales bacterium]